MTGLSRAFSKRQRPTSNCLASGGCKVSTRKWPNASDDFYGLWMLVIQSQHIAVFLKWTPNTTRFNTQMVIHDLDDLDVGKSQNSQFIPTHPHRKNPSAQVPQLTAAETSRACESSIVAGPHGPGQQNLLENLSIFVTHRDKMGIKWGSNGMMSYKQKCEFDMI